MLKTKGGKLLGRWEDGVWEGRGEERTEHGRVVSFGEAREVRTYRAQCSWKWGWPGRLEIHKCCPGLDVGSNPLLRADLIIGQSCNFNHSFQDFIVQTL